MVPRIEPFKGDARRLAHGPSGMEVSSVLGPQSIVLLD